MSGSLLSGARIPKCYKDGTEKRFHKTHEDDIGMKNYKSVENLQTYNCKLTEFGLRIGRKEVRFDMIDDVDMCQCTEMSQVAEKVRMKRR